MKMVSGKATDLDDQISKSGLSLPLTHYVTLVESCLVGVSVSLFLRQEHLLYFAALIYPDSERTYERVYQVES